MSSYLFSVDLSSVSVPEREKFWSRILDIARQQGSKSFTLDERFVSRSTGRTGHKAAQRLELVAAEEVVIGAGTSGRCVNLYSESGWVAGTSDWVEDVSILVDRAGRESVLQLLDEHDSLPRDLAVTE